MLRSNFAALGAAIALCGAAHAGPVTQYTLTGAQYEVSSGCAGTYCSGGPYDLTVSFDVAAGTPLDNLTIIDGQLPGGTGFGNLTAFVTSFSFADGSGFTLTKANATSYAFNIATDANGNPTAWSIGAGISPPPYFAPGSSAAEAGFITYWFPSYPQVYDATTWSDGSEDGNCFAYGQGVVQTSGCLGNWTMSTPGGAAPEPSALLLMGIGLVALTVKEFWRKNHVN